MTQKEVVLDKKLIFPTHFPRPGSSLDLARANKLSDIKMEGVSLDEWNGKYYVAEGHHRIGRAFELAEGKLIKVEVTLADIQTQRNIHAAMIKCRQYNEQIGYDDFIKKTRWFRREV